MNTYLDDIRAILGRPWVTLAILIVISLAFCGVYANESENGPLHSIQASFASILSPLSFTETKIDQGVLTLNEYLDEVSTDGETLAELKAENQKLKALLVKSESYKQEAERLQKLLNYRDKYNVEGICASVIGKSSSSWNKTISINSGSDSGICAGQTVIGVDGVVGQVISAYPGTSIVRLLTDPNSGVAVKLQNTQADCMLRGSLESVLYIEDLDVNVQVSVGDVVVTSGLGGSYVEGLAVGKVNQIIQNSSGSGRKLVVTPVEQSGSISEVFVITGSKDSSDDK